MSQDKLYDRPEVCDTYFFPMPGPDLPRSERAAPVDLSLPDGTRLGAYWSHPLDRAPAMLYLHGNGECIGDQLDHWPAWAAEAGANILLVDYPGYASSDGIPTFTSCCQAAMAGLSFLLQLPEAEVPAVVIAGRSVGSIFALHAAAEVRSARLAGLVLESAVADLKPRLEMRLPYERLGINRDQINGQLDRDFDHQAKIGGLGIPVLILHTRHDSLVPAWNGQRLAQWAGPNLYRLELFEAGDHNDIQWTNAAAYRGLLRSFMIQVSTSAPSTPGIL